MRLTTKGRFAVTAMVDLAMRQNRGPVTLAAIKAEPRLQDMALVKYPRLSVQPVTADEWKMVCKMGGL